MDALDRAVGGIDSRLRYLEDGAKSGLFVVSPELRQTIATGYELRTYLSKLPSTIGDLLGRTKELRELSHAWSNANTRIIMFSAMGGVGKTALVSHWLTRMQKRHYGGARVYGWSFYSQGTSEDRQVGADQFIAHALDWFGDPDPTKGSPWDKGVRLAGLIAREKTLLILDGLEPIQYPPGEMTGRLRDQGVQAMLKELARWGSDWGLCVITTCLVVPELEAMTGPVKHVPLDNLSDEAGADLLRKLGVTHGTDEELREAAR